MKIYKKGGHILKNVVTAAIAGLVILVIAGCDTPPIAPAQPGGSDVAAGYGAAEIHIVGLTEIVPSDVKVQGLEIKAYVELLDSFGSKVKSPGIFRFELYEFAPRSPEPKGKRLLIWPVIDITEPTANNSHWHDFLRAYKFNLDLNINSKADKFMLQVTCTTPAGRRLSDVFEFNGRP